MTARSGATPSFHLGGVSSSSLLLACEWPCISGTCEVDWGCWSVQFDNESDGLGTNSEQNTNITTKKKIIRATLLASFTQRTLPNTGVAAGISLPAERSWCLYPPMYSEPCPVRALFFVRQGIRRAGRGELAFTIVGGRLLRGRGGSFFLSL